MPRSTWHQLRRIFLAISLSVTRAIKEPVLNLLLLLALSFLALTPAHALDPNRQISQYGHTAWKTSDGILNRPSYVTQTMDGYIWVNTADGLMRFDGVRFKMWVPPKAQPSPTGVTFLLGARDGSLWIATSRGLFRLQNDELFDYSPQLRGAGINKMIEDHGGTIWFTRYRIRDANGPLCRIANKQIHCYGLKDGIPARYGLSLTEDSAGNIWFGSNVLYRWAPGSTATYFAQETKHTGGDGVPELTSGPSGSVWAALDGVGPKLGLRYYSEGKWTSYVVPGLNGAKTRIGALFMDRHHSLWIGAESEGIYRIHDGVAQHYGELDRLTGKSAEGFYEDREGGIWVVTEAGLDLFRDKPVVTFASGEGLRARDISAVLALRNGSVWVADEGALQVINSHGVSTISAGHGLPGQDPEGMFEDHSGRIWIGIDDRIMTYKNGRFSEIRSQNGNPLGHIGIAIGFAQDKHANLWALTYSKTTGQNRLLRIQDERVRQNIPLDHLFHRAKFLAADRVGGVWITGDSGELVRLRDGSFEVFHLVSGDLTFANYSLLVDSANGVWVSTNRGLFHWTDGHVNVLDSRSGLPCSVIFSAITDDSGNFWLYAKCGILKISVSDLAAWLRAPGTKVSPTVFDQLDGALTGPPRSHQPQNAKSPDGRLWFMTDARVQVIDPIRYRPDSKPPPVHIDELVADHKNYDLRRAITLPHLRGELEIDYTALSLTVPQRVRFRYKLEGHDSEWQDPGTRRQAFYTDLGPRKYNFRVIACNNDGVWNDQGATLDFTVTPTWYQTNWFRLSCVAAFCLLVWTLYRLRLHQLASELNTKVEASVAERTRIARELHDTLLQSLHGLMFRFQAARNMLPRRPEEAMEALDGAITRTEQAIAESRDAIKDLRPDPSAQNNIADVLTAMGQELASSHKTNHVPPVFSVIVEGQPRPLSTIVQDEARRIAHEVLANAFRHAEAHRIEAEIRYDPHSLRLRFRDDGNGINPEVLEVGGRPGHWGLLGIRERAQRIGAQLEFWSETGAGTEVQLKVPAAVAYERVRGGVPVPLLRKEGNREQ